MMNWPQHKDPEGENRVAKAPYNFVPLPEKVVEAASLARQDRYDANCHTGHFDCTLTTESPLYVRCGLTPPEFAERAEGNESKESKSLPDFFYTDPKSKLPVIPGSSLRGMLRGLVEIIGYAKIQPVSSQKLFYRAVADKMLRTFRQSYQAQMGDVRAGYVHERHGSYFIQPARTIEGRTFFKVKEAVLKNGRLQFISILDEKNYRPQYVTCWFVTREGEVVQASAESQPGYEQGILVCSGPFGQKKRKHWIVPACDDEAKCLPIPEETARDYFATLTEYQKKTPFDKERGCLVPGHPVFYLEDRGQVVDFGPTRNFRVGYRIQGQMSARSPQDFVPSELRSDDRIDLAEAIFGYVGHKSGREARAGRVYVSDATLIDGQDDVFLSDEPITGHILSSPKPTTFQHYLVQQTPDLKPAGKGSTKYELSLSHYAGSTPGETVIRGHKLYWHKGGVAWRDDQASRAQIAEDADKVQPEEADTKHPIFKPVRTGVSFRFRIHFENLSEVELGVLLWALTLPGPDEYRHKLGMGKPLGMGSAKIDSVLHLTDRSARYETLFKDDNWYLGDDSLDAKDVAAQALHEFEQLIVKDEMLNPRLSAKSLSEVERIKTVLALLQWPGPDPADTRYMTITSPNEFSDRKVLPTPLGLLEGKETGKNRRPRSEGVPSEQRASQPLPKGYQTGQEVRAVVESGWSKNGVLVVLPDGSKGKLRVSKRAAPSVDEKLTVVVDGMSGSFYKLRLLGDAS